MSVVVTHALFIAEEHNLDRGGKWSLMHRPAVHAFRVRHAPPHTH